MLSDLMLYTIEVSKLTFWPFWLRLQLSPFAMSSCHLNFSPYSALPQISIILLFWELICRIFVPALNCLDRRYDMTWQDMTWHDMTWHDMTWVGQLSDSIFYSISLYPLICWLVPQVYKGCMQWMRTLSHAAFLPLQQAYSQPHRQKRWVTCNNLSIFTLIHTLLALSPSAVLF